MYFNLQHYCIGYTCSITCRVFPRYLLYPLIAFLLLFVWFCHFILCYVLQSLFVIFKGYRYSLIIIICFIISYCYYYIMYYIVVFWLAVFTLTIMESVLHFTELHIIALTSQEDITFSSWNTQEGRLLLSFRAHALFVVCIITPY